MEKKEPKIPKIPKILFYTSIPRSFRTTLIGYLYEIAQVFPVVLLAEEFDPETQEILKDKELFPKLEKIIPVRQYTGEKTNLFFKNRSFYKLAKTIIQEQRPDIVITANDVYPFELYLLRFAKKMGSLNICFQAGLQFKEEKEMVIWSHLMNAFSQYPSFFPLPLRLSLVSLKKWFGHLLYYWILPILVGEKPFRGKSSFIFLRDNQALRDADYRIVFSKRDFDSYTKCGISAENLYILPHPLEQEVTKNFFKETLFMNTQIGEKTNKKILTILLPVEKIGFQKGNLALISEDILQKNRIKITATITKILKGWNIFIKPHPMVKDNPEEFKKITLTLESISNLIKVADPLESAEKYIEISDVIVGIPPASTTLFMASLQCPKKPILALDFHQEVLGDYYKDFDGIEYIDSEEKFINILELIRDNKYCKKYRQEANEKERRLETKIFSNTIEVINWLYDNRLTA